MKNRLLDTSAITHCVAVIAAVMGYTTSAAAAESWAEFRGPTGQGHSASTNLPLEWSETKNIQWKTEVPGLGHSSPVILGDQIWMTTAITKMLSPEEKLKRLAGIQSAKELKLADTVSLRAICFDRGSGKVIQNIELFNVKKPIPVHTLNSYASPTPVLEEGRLYCHFGAMGTCALDTKTGKVVWKQQFKIRHTNGPGASPVVWKNLMIVQCDGTDVQYVVAVNKSDGEVAWKTNRSGSMHDDPEYRKCYATPLVVENKGRPLLISQGADWVYGYDVRDGSEVWRAKYGDSGFSIVPRPVTGNGLVYLSTSFMRSKLLAVRYDGKGDVSKSAIAWRYEKQVPKKPSLLLVGTELYMVSDQGVATCLDAKTGKEHWRQRLGGNYSASPIFADGRIYFSSHEGVTTVIKPGTKYERLATNQLDGRLMASPAVVDSAIYLRTDSALYRIER